MRSTSAVSALLVLVGLVGPLRSQAQHFESPVTQVALLELYTSEGCSSCPPAEQWLSQLTEDEGLWKSFVPVAFHVDYWDQLGWQDSFASHQATQREYSIASAWGSQSVYTPCFVLNGREWRPDHSRLTGSSKTPTGVLKATQRDDGVWDIEYKPASPQESALDATVALLGHGILSSIRRGENAGRKLQHDFSVLSFTEQPLASSPDGVWRATLKLPALTQQPSGRRALAVWVVQHGSITPLQATGGWLTENSHHPSQ